MKKFIKWFFIVMLILVIGFLIFRIFSYEDKSVFDDFEVTEASRGAYEEGLNVLTLDLKDKHSDNGYFCAYSMFYVEETGELQVTVRYNKSAAKYTDRASTDDLDFRLMVRKEDDSDKKDGRYRGTYYAPVSVEKKSRYGIYEYRKLVFEGLDMTAEEFGGNNVVVVMTDKSASDTDYALFFDRQFVHYAGQPTDTYDLSKSDRKELEK